MTIFCSDKPLVLLVATSEKSLRDPLRHLVARSERDRRAFPIEELPVLFPMATGVDTRDILNRWLKPLEE